MSKRRGSRGKRTSLHDLTRESLSEGDLTSFFRQISTSNDRTVALAGGAAIEQNLVRLLQQHFIPLDTNALADTFYEPDALLGTLAKRVSMVYLLGLIDKHIKADLDRIRRIRNVFAHRVHDLEFSRPQIAKECSALKFANQEGSATPREQFTSAVFNLDHLITLIVIGGLREQLSAAAKVLEKIGAPDALRMAQKIREELERPSALDDISKRSSPKKSQ